MQIYAEGRRVRASLPICHQMPGEKYRNVLPVIILFYIFIVKSLGTLHYIAVHIFCKSTSHHITQCPALVGAWKKSCFYALGIFRLPVTVMLHNQPFAEVNSSLYLVNSSQNQQWYQMSNGYPKNYEAIQTECLGQPSAAASLLSMKTSQKTNSCQFSGSFHAPQAHLWIWQVQLPRPQGKGHISQISLNGDKWRPCDRKIFQACK